MRTTRVSTTTGGRTTLSTDDTLTLALPGMQESTPAQLRALISQQSLRRIAERSPDSNERSKAARALNASTVYWSTSDDWGTDGLWSESIHPDRCARQCGFDSTPDYNSVGLDRLSELSDREWYDLLSAWGLCHSLVSEEAERAVLAEVARRGGVSVLTEHQIGRTAVELLNAQ